MALNWRDVDREYYRQKVRAEARKRFRREEKRKAKSDEFLKKLGRGALYAFGLFVVVAAIDSAGPDSTQKK